MKTHRQVLSGATSKTAIAVRYEEQTTKGELLSIAAHQLRTPLGISKWYLEAIFETTQPIPKKVAHYLKQIYENNERMIDIVRKLLSVARIEQGRVPCSPEAVDVLKIIDTTVSQLSVLAKQYKVRVMVKVQPGLPALSIDPLCLREILENLLSDAIEYNHVMGTVEITAMKAGDKIQIRVCDSGIGIPKADMARLFSRFYRSSAGIAQKPTGCGLGLYIVKTYVKQCGGHISVESQEGKGSTFTVTLPYDNNNNKEVAHDKEKNITG